MKFEFSCREILDAIGVEIEKAQKEYTSQEKYIHALEEEEEKNKKRHWYDRSFYVGIKTATEILTLSRLRERLYALKDTKNLFQTQPSDKKYNLTLGECGEYGLVGGEQPVKETWRGWQGHFCCKCEWHLNTLVEYQGKKYVISTVGQYRDPLRKEYGTIGLGRTFETMVFDSAYDEWDDADVGKEKGRFFRGYTTEQEAQKGHYEVLAEVKKWLQDVSSK